MDNARQKLGQGFKSVRHPLWRQDALMKNEKSHLHKLSDTLPFNDNVLRYFYECTKYFII